MSTYAPPPGPPPSYHPAETQSSYAPPPGPPPTQTQTYQPAHALPSDLPPPYEHEHNWTSIPDTALLPPPPALTSSTSPGANASASDAEAGRRWCTHPSNKLWEPRALTSTQREEVQAGHIRLIKPSHMVGEILPRENGSEGAWRVRTSARCKDALILSGLPLYSKWYDSPLSTRHRKTVYYEVHIRGIGRQGAYEPPPAAPEIRHDEKRGKLSRLFGRDKSSSSSSSSSSHHTHPSTSSSSAAAASEPDAALALGFTAPPYPTFRLPGWHRGSLGVHSDDGHRYTNNPEGGIPFITNGFQSPNTRVGLGMTFSLPSKPPAYEGGAEGNKMDIEVFFTRDGEVCGRWDGNEEVDVREEGGTMGIVGDADLFAAVGVFGGCDFEVLFREEEWLYRPPRDV